MGTFVYLAFVPVASFVVLAQPAGAQGASTTLPLTYHGQVLQGGGSQTCPSGEQREMVKNEVDNATLNLLRESIVPILQGYLYSCGGSTGWKRVAYLNMSGSSQQCPSAWKEITTPHRVCGRTSTRASCEGLTYSTGSEQYDQVCGRIIGYQIGNQDSFQTEQSINRIYVDGISVTLANTSGLLLLVLMKEIVTITQHVPVSLEALLEIIFPHLWARTTSVRQA